MTEHEPDKGLIQKGEVTGQHEYDGRQKGSDTLMNRGTMEERREETTDEQ